MKPPEIQNDLEFDTIILSSIDNTRTEPFPRELLISDVIRKLSYTLGTKLQSATVMNKFSVFVRGIETDILELDIKVKGYDDMIIIIRIFELENVYIRVCNLFSEEPYNNIWDYILETLGLEPYRNAYMIRKITRAGAI